MAWINPTLRTTGDIVAVSVWNADVIENLSFLGSQHDHDGDAGDGATRSLSVPSGLIAIFDTTCPSGWTRVSAFDYNLLKPSPSYGTTGGEQSHTHAVNLSDYTSFSPNPFSLYPLYEGNTSWAAMGYESSGEALYMFPHDSSGSWPITSLLPLVSWKVPAPTIGASGLGGTSEPYPPYIDVVFCKKD